MSQRERYLAIAVGVVLALLVVNIGFKKIVGNLRTQEDRLDATYAELESLNNAINMGNRAKQKIAQLRIKSLPSKPEIAEAQYKEWLYQLAATSGLTQVKITSLVSRRVRPKNQPNEAPDAFTLYDFKLKGRCRLDKTIELLGHYYDRNYLHRISSLNLKPARDADLVEIDLTSQVISLPRAGDNYVPPLQPSGRLAMSIDQYKSSILKRNPFSPLNQPPNFQNSPSQQVTIGQNWQLKLEATDPEGHAVSYELVQDTPLPEGMTFKDGQLKWRATEKGQQRLTVRAIDDGWPQRHTELTLVLTADEAAQVVAPIGVDPAQQAFLTGLVTGRSGAQGWIRSQVDGLSVGIHEGADIQIGSVTAKVISIHVKGDYVELESDGVRWKMDMKTSLAEAYQKRQLD